MKKSDKLFLNDDFFRNVTLISVVGYVIGIAAVILSGSESVGILLTLDLALIAICDMALYISYEKHAKNVMKGMMGALLTAQLLMALSFAEYISGVLDGVLAVIFIILSAMMFTTHFIINGTHLSSPKAVRLNRIVLVLLAAVNLIWVITYLPQCSTVSDYILRAVDVLTLPCLLASIVCVESRLDASRIDREDAGWTEEKGYPEGYIHEYEKGERK